jgi:hypothetical protein
MILVLFYSTRALAGVAAGQGGAGAQPVAFRSVAGSASGSTPVSGRIVEVESRRATATGNSPISHRYFVVHFRQKNELPDALWRTRDVQLGKMEVDCK